MAFTSLQQLYQLYPVQVARDVAQKTGVPIYLVGGAVRDALSGASPVDCDFAVAGKLEEIVDLFTRRVRGHAIPWDESQTRVVYRERGGRHVSVDFAQYKAGTILEDLRLRDFTINAMAVDIAGMSDAAEPDIIDPLGSRDDLEKNLVRMCGPSCFDDDPLRMLRAIRFARQLGFEIDPATLELCTRRHERIGSVSVERIKKELFTIFGLPAPALSFRQLLHTGLLGYLVPETRGWDEFEQCLPHRYSLLEHSLRTIEQLEKMMSSSGMIAEYFSEVLEEGVTRRSLLVLAGFLHDSGKPAAASYADGRRSFHGHDRAGAQINLNAAERLGLGRRCRRMVESITAHHMRLLELSLLDTVTERAKVRFLRDCGGVAAEVALLSLADMLATSSAPAYQAQVQAACELGEELLGRALLPAQGAEHGPLLTGADILAELDIAAGPRVGAILEALHAAERRGLINTREEALAWLKSQQCPASSDQG